MGKRAELTDLDKLFISIYLEIRENGVPVDLALETTSKKMDASNTCYEIDRMVALCRKNGIRELGVRSEKTLMIGMFPSMDKKGKVRDVLPERRDYYKKNLEYYQARLKL